MQSNKLPRLAELKKILKKILKKYNQFEDVIIFGSFVKGRDSPKDIDLAFIVKEKNLETVANIKEDLGFSKAHVELINVNDVYSNTLFLSLINEGYSIKQDKFLRDILGVRPMRL